MLIVHWNISFPESCDFHLYGPCSTYLRCEPDAFAAEKLIVEQEHASPGAPISVAATPKLLALLDELVKEALA